MKNQVGVVVLLASMFLMACTSGNHQKQTVSAGVLEYDSLAIPIDYPCLGFYYHTAHYKDGNTLYWAGYNHLLHTIEVFDLTNRQTVHEWHGRMRVVWLCEYYSKLITVILLSLVRGCFSKNM